MHQRIQIQEEHALGPKEMRMQAKVELCPSQLKDLTTQYKKVFAEHELVRAYSLSDEAREKMFTYLKQMQVT